MCHHHSQAGGQSRRLPGHLVSPLPAALTWHRVDCGPPAGTGSLLQWSFSHKEIRTYTYAMWDCRALKTKGQIQRYKKHLFNRRFKALPSQALSRRYAEVVKVDLFRRSPQQKHLKAGGDRGKRMWLSFLLMLFKKSFYHFLSTSDEMQEEYRKTVLPDEVGVWLNTMRGA